MTIITYSPTPWTCDYSPYTVRDTVDRELPAFEIFDADGNKLFDTNEDMPSEAQEANARLAVAAPELLAACQLVVERWEKGDLAEAARACQSAGAKAVAGFPTQDFREAAVTGCGPFSVLLMYPEYIGEDRTEPSFYYTHVEARDADDAVAVARREAADDEEITCERDDIVALLVTRGHNRSIPACGK